MQEMLTLDTDGIRELLVKKRKRPDCLHGESANWGELKERAKRLCDAEKSMDARTLSLAGKAARALAGEEPYFDIGAAISSGCLEETGGQTILCYPHVPGFPGTRMLPHDPGCLTIC